MDVLRREDEDDGLTTQRREFVEQLLVHGFNATAAAIAAGYSAKSARGTAHKLLKDDRVMAAINRRAGDRLRDVELNARNVLQGLSALAFFDISQVVSWDEDGIRVRPSSELPAHLTYAIKKIKETKFETVDKHGDVTSVRTTLEFEAHDKVKPLELVTKYVAELMEAMRAAGDILPERRDVQPFGPEVEIETDDDRNLEVARILLQAGAIEGIVVGSDQDAG